MYVVAYWFDKQQMNLIGHNGNASFTPGTVKR